MFTGSRAEAEEDKSARIPRPSSMLRLSDLFYYDATPPPFSPLLFPSFLGLGSIARKDFKGR